MAKELGVYLLHKVDWLSQGIGLLYGAVATLVNHYLPQGTARACTTLCGATCELTQNCSIKGERTEIWTITSCWPPYCFINTGVCC